MYALVGRRLTTSPFSSIVRRGNQKIIKKKKLLLLELRKEEINVV